MRSRLAALAAAAAACSGGRVAMSPADRERLAAEPAEIPVVYRPSPAPWVDCSTNEGELLWTLPGCAWDERRGGDRPWSLAARRGSGALAIERASAPAAPPTTGGNIWEQFEAGYTESLRAPPLDPARATADALAAAGAAASPPLRLGRARQADRDSRAGSAPVLLVETTRFVLVGCWYTYRPWFDVRATLVDGASGRILWRDACSELYPVPPVDSRPPASPARLATDGGALYAGFIRDRAAQCAGALVGRLGRAGR
ncbi:MAG TPA: hypothetical protein VLU43_04440 [Anaeromyxobacteraceae bacterium]|nr:hypothetical protein [Anaeromyxobacteraceae bacterium]